MKYEYPLQWLPQQPRTKKPSLARFGKHTLYYTGNLIENELRLLGAKDCIISSNLQTKKSGGFYANQKIDDTGITIYFKLKDSNKAMACDKWNKSEDNLWALLLSIRAIRGLERWGGSEFLDGLFTGFKALPSPEQVTNTTVRYFDSYMTLEEGKTIFKNLALELHPDKGGNQNEFMELNKQFNQFKQRFI